MLNHTANFGAARLASLQKRSKLASLQKQQAMFLTFTTMTSLFALCHAIVFVKLTCHVCVRYGMNRSESIYLYCGPEITQYDYIEVVPIYSYWAKQMPTPLYQVQDASASTLFPFELRHWP